MLKFRVSTKGGRSFSHEVDLLSVTIGRSSNADVSVPDRSLSREHARMECVDGIWRVVDLGSRNGTLLNGELIVDAPEVVSGDVLELGATTLEVLDPGKEAFSGGTAEYDAGGSIFVPAADLLGDSIDSTAKSHEARDLPKYVERLHILNEVHNALAGSMALDELLELILDRVFDHLRPEEGAVFLRQGREYICASHRSKATAVTGVAPLYSRHLIDQVAEKGMAALVLDAEIDERFNAAASLIDAGIRSLVAAPLLGGEDGRTLGFIVLGSMLHSRQFTEEDMQLLTSLASVAAMRIRNVRLVAEAMERQKLEQEVALARRIQVALLPNFFPDLDGYDLFGRNLPSRGVSGDFFKIVERQDGNECVILLADVSGKGIAASLLTASLEALVTVPIDSGGAPDEICDVVSKLLYQRTPPEKYATAFLGALETATGVLRYVNAGHNPGILLRSNGESQWLRSGGRPIGLLPGGSYEMGTVTLGAGDCLFIYTDGLTEAENPDQEEFSEDRLLESVKRHWTLELNEMADAIEAELEEWASGVPFADDRTVVILKKNA